METGVSGTQARCRRFLNVMGECVTPSKSNSRVSLEKRLRELSFFMLGTGAEEFCGQTGKFS